MWQSGKTMWQSGKLQFFFALHSKSEGFWSEKTDEKG
jgi:hypothetical protein